MMDLSGYSFRILAVMTTKEIIGKYPDYFTFDLEKWLRTPGNILYRREDDLAFAELRDDICEVHMCFHTSRGKDAIELVNRILHEFVEVYSPKSIVGLVHENNTPAKVVLRRAGWSSLGLTNTTNGVCEMFTPKLTRY
jgi:hypothetical protein